MLGASPMPKDTAFDKKEDSRVTKESSSGDLKARAAEKAVSVAKPAEQDAFVGRGLGHAVKHLKKHMNDEDCSY